MGLFCVTRFLPERRDWCEGLDAPHENKHRRACCTLQSYPGAVAAPQITYYGLHQFFLTERAVYVIVWDVTRFEGLSGEALDEVSSVSNG